MLRCTANIIMYIFLDVFVSQKCVKNYSLRSLVLLTSQLQKDFSVLAYCFLSELGTHLWLEQYKGFSKSIEEKKF